uniref:Uncharacterized protein n=1 Tax=Picea glauca TaxID=3330 RepID=A0A101M0Y5_PICGL|nr:hypothetical protein ABT39_MTgene4238 [Picea glauca]QHR87871.1 hypothetical protein Q903MT_gene1883 [Picea sitchensis]
MYAKSSLSKCLPPWVTTKARCAFHLYFGEFLVGSSCYSFSSKILVGREFNPILIENTIGWWAWVVGGPYLIPTLASSFLTESTRFGTNRLLPAFLSLILKIQPLTGRREASLSSILTLNLCKGTLLCCQKAH